MRDSKRILEETDANRLAAQKEANKSPWSKLPADPLKRRSWETPEKSSMKNLDPMANILNGLWSMIVQQLVRTLLLAGSKITSQDDQVPDHPSFSVVSPSSPMCHRSFN